MRKLLVLIVLILCFDVMAQDDTFNPVITADNILQLESVHQLSFETDLYYHSFPNGERGSSSIDIDVGWFVYHTERNDLLIRNSDNVIYPLAIDGNMTNPFSYDNAIDAIPFGSWHYAVLSTTSEGFIVHYTSIQYSGRALYVNVISSAIPTAIWITCSETTSDNGEGCYANVQDTTSTIFTLPSFIPLQGEWGKDIEEGELEQRPYLPASDKEAVVRIGRIPLPYVVTSSLDGIVKLWDLDTDEVLYEVDNGTGEPSVFGNINADATHLVWRDNANQTLYLLNFETGENREIAPLNGDYAQWYFLTNDASAIIAVNLGGEPNVVVWDTTTGERTDLGDYRECERPQPDMARLTEDGTTLIIGCDTGLDIWRINLEG